MKLIGLLLGVVLSFNLKAGDLTLAPGDQVSISVYGNPELSVDASVSLDGTVNLPLIGKVNVQDQTITEAESAIENRFVEGGFLRKAQVDLTLISSINNQVSLLGAVGKSGKYPIGPGVENLFDLIALSGGIPQIASDELIVLRKQNGVYQRLFFNLDKLITEGTSEQLNDERLKLQPADLIYVEYAPVFYTYGEVGNASFPIKENIILQQALSMAGGLSKIADDDDIKIKRLGENGKYQILKAEMDTLIKPNDIIIVEESLF